MYYKVKSCNNKSNKTPSLLFGASKKLYFILVSRLFDAIMFATSLLSSMSAEFIPYLTVF